MLCLLKRPDCHAIHPERGVLSGRIVHVDHDFPLPLPLVKPHG